MPCYFPLRACLVSGPEGRRIAFNRDAVGKALSLPCSKCIGCRLERARQWAVRCVHEAQFHDDSSFLTLTYNKENLPKGGTLVKKHVSTFLKALRGKLTPIKIRFFACGEYGDKFARPHYHVLLFGYSFPDKQHHKTRNGRPLYISPLLDSVWQMGDCSIGAVSFDSAMYTANYACKKLHGSAAESHYKGRLPEFLLMSRNPGLGKKWIEKYKDEVYPSDEIIVNGKQQRPPRYYDLLCLSEGSALSESVKKKRDLQAEKLEDLVLKSGVRIGVAPSRNARRLAIRRVVRVAKQKLKHRNYEEKNHA